MRMDQRQLLTPRMIQSMEILQLPMMALEERIEQELQNNPVLEMRDLENEAGSADATASTVENGEARQEFSESEQPMVVKDNQSSAEDFDRLAKIGEYFENEEFNTNGSNFRQSSYDGERDKKLDAMNNTAARGITLAEHLLNQWAFIECTPAVRAAGEMLINYIDSEGYLRRGAVRADSAGSKNRSAAGRYAGGTAIDSPTGAGRYGRAFAFRIVAPAIGSVGPGFRDGGRS